MKAKKKMLPQAVLGVIGAALIASPAFAQQGKVEKIEVTGSNIKRVDTETAAPVVIITAEEIRQSGRQTVTELLRELPSNAAGGLTELTGGGSFSAGAATISLRGLGSTATLTLLNGRRVAPYGLADPNFGQSGVVNLNSIPLDAIERIEILKDGASAIYGSEAISGVVNIILKKDFKGGQIGVAGTENQDGHYRSTTVTASLGFGDLGKDRYNVFMNVEGFKADPVLLRDVDSFLNREPFRVIGGVGVANSSYSPFISILQDQTGAFVGSTTSACPASNVVSAVPIIGIPGVTCLYDQWTRVEIVPAQERQSIFARGTIDISANTSLFAEYSFVNSEIKFAGDARVLGQGQGGTFNAATGRLNLQPAALPIGHPNNPFNRATQFRWRANGVGFADQVTESDTTRAVAGVKTVLGRFDFESALMYNKSEVENQRFNFIRYTPWINAIANGFNLITGTGGGTTFDQLRIDPKTQAESEFTVFDAKLSGETGMILAGGPVGMAAGYEYRREKRLVTATEESGRGEVIGLGIGTAEGSRNVSTLFAEFVLPMTKAIEVQLAARYDKYSDYGSSFTPKIAAAWRISDKLKARASYASGFRAPALTEITRSATSGFFNGVLDPRRCQANFTGPCSASVPGIIVANPLVKPEKAMSYVAGLVFEPTKDFDISLDYFAISRRNEISFLSLNEILFNEGSTDPRYAGRVVRDPTNTSPLVANDPGALLFVSTGFDNLGETRVKGMDIDARQRFNFRDWGKLTLRFQGTRYFDQRGSGAPGAKLTSYSGFRNAPEGRATLTGTWELGNWISNARVNWIDGFRAHANPETLTGTALTAALNCANPNQATYLGTCRVSEYYTVDLGTEYRGFKKLRVGLTVRNVANTKPSFDPLARPFNFAWYSPSGRNFAFNARYDF